MRLLNAAIGGAILYALACLFSAYPVLAAQCGPWDKMLQMAFDQYGELPAFISVTDSGAVLTITINPDKHTFTIFAQPNAETMCAVASGTDWSEAPAAVRDGPKKNAGDPA